MFVQRFWHLDRGEGENLGEEKGGVVLKKKTEKQVISNLIQQGGE